MFAYRRDPIRFLRSALQQHGDIFRFRVLGLPLVMINHPDLVKRVLVDNSDNYDKDNFLYRVVRPVLREGLIANVGGEIWRRQRKLMTPSFLPRTVALFARTMTDETQALLERWERSPGVGGTTDLAIDIGDLVLRIVTRSLFNTSIEQSNLELQQAFYEANSLFGDYFRLPFPPLSVPTPRNRRMRALVRRMDDLIYRFIQEQVNGTARIDQPTLLSMLMAAIDDETGANLSIEQLKQEVLNLVVGAYETTTNTIVWAFYLLARHPEAEARVHAEIAGVCGARVPTYEDLAHLHYTRMVVDETLRLYSPAWQVMRRAIQDDRLGDYHIPANANIYINSFFLHRHPAFWDRPEEFIPERFTPERIAARPKHAYIPFGSGSRICLGKYFALTEAQLVMVTIMQRFRLLLPEGFPPVEPEPLLTLHPRGGVHVTLTGRSDRHAGGGVGDPGGDRAV